MYPLGCLSVLLSQGEDFAKMVDLGPADHSIAGSAAGLAQAHQAGRFGCLRNAVHQHPHWRSRCLATEAVEFGRLQGGLPVCLLDVQEIFQSLAENEVRALGLHDGQSSPDPVADRAR